MPPLNASRPRVDVEQLERLVVFHFQDVRVSGNEELGWRSIDLRAYAWVVVARISPDVSHQHVHIFTLPLQPFGVYPPQVATVAIAIDGSQRAELIQPLRHFYRPDIASVPNLVTRLEVVQVFIVPIGVGVADDSYFFHVYLMWRMG